MSWQEPPPPPQIRHWYWKVIGAEPRHVPGFAVTVLPAATSPLIVGAEPLEGAAVDVLVTADAAEAATRTATAANTGARRKRFMVETSVAGCEENSRRPCGQNRVLRSLHGHLHGADDPGARGWQRRRTSGKYGRPYRSLTDGKPGVSRTRPSARIVI